MRLLRPEVRTPGPALGTGATLYNGTVALHTTQLDDGRFALVDSTRNGSRVIDVRGDAAITDDDNVWGEPGDPANQRAALDADYAVQMTWDFLRDVLGRNGLDDRGRPLSST
jgi:Zn-dependent metalloprotease